MIFDAQGGTRRWKQAVAVLGAAVISIPLSASVAAAAVVPPTGNHVIMVHPETDMVLLEGWEDANGLPLTVKVVRNGAVIGTASIAALSGGGVEFNHEAEAPDCWTGVTPDILPGDTVEVYVNNSLNGEAVTAAPLTASPAVAEDVDGDGRDEVVIRGEIGTGAAAALAAGDALDALLISQDFRSLRNPSGTAYRHRMLAPSDAGDAHTATITADAISDANPAGTKFTVTFGNLTPEAVQVALQAGAEVGYAEGASAITAIEIGEQGGPTVGCDAPAARHAVTGVDRTLINVASTDAPLVVSGIAANATAVTVRLTDSTGATAEAPAQLTGTGAAQTWTASVGHSTLGQGELTVSAAYTVDGGIISGRALATTVTKDTIAPAMPQASFTTGAGTFDVTLTRGEAGDAIRYNLGNLGEVTDATLESAVYGSGVLTWNAAGTIRAFAVDAAGNRSDMLRADHVVRPTAPGALTGMPQADGSVALTWTAPSTDGGSAITGYRLRVLDVDGALLDTVETAATSATVTSVVGTPLALGSAYRFTVEAVTAHFGEGNAAATTGAVVAAMVPSAPTVASAVAGSASATVSWTPGATNGSDVTAYTVRVLNGTSLVQTVQVGGEATSVKVTGLTNGKTYKFSVAATNAMGVSGSALSSAVVPVGRPGQVVIGTAASGAAGGTVSATARWAAALSNGSPITSYQVRALKLDATGKVVKTYTVTVAAGKRYHTMVLPAGTYQFDVIAVNVLGAGPRSARSNKVLAR